jgi:nucleotide-binding universal stress UspA family protein
MPLTLPKTILVATDLSACAEKAVSFAILLAKKLDAQLWLIHAWQYPFVDCEPGIALPGEVFTIVEKRHRAAFEAALVAAQQELPFAQGKTDQGDAREVIMETAAAISADLIIVGTHGRRGLNRALMGSVAEHVVRHASCPVLSISEHDKTQAAARI